jgi:hypothetical protein
MREEAKVQIEIEKARRTIEKEKNHYLNATLKLREQLNVSVSDIEKEVLEMKLLELANKLDEIEKSIKDIDYREANQKAGYVYIVSNIHHLEKIFIR